MIQNNRDGSCQAMCGVWNYDSNAAVKEGNNNKYLISTARFVF